MPTLVRRLTAHWPLKLASLALALLLWVLVSAEQPAAHWMTVRVEPEVRDPRLVMSGAPRPAQVRVLFAGPGRLLWQVALTRPTLILPVRVAQPGGYALEAPMIRLPDGVRGVAVRQIRPAVIRLEVEELAAREVPVRPRFARGSSFVVRGEAEVFPATVRVSGPAHDLARLRFVETEPLTLVSADSATFSARVALDTVGLGDFTLRPATVRVRGEVDLRAERTLRDVAVRAQDGTSSGVADLRVTGPARVLEALRERGVRVEETAAGQRISGLPASVQGVVVARRQPPTDSAAP